MSKYLLDEYPLVVLPKLAVRIGLEEAIILQQVHYWLEENKKTAKNFKDGKYWTYNTYEEWQEQFPFWSISTIRRKISSLETSGLLVSGNYNDMKIDRTKWYTVGYDLLNTICENEQGNDGIEENCNCPDRTNATVQNEQMQTFNLNSPIPETNTETNTETNSYCPSSKKSDVVKIKSTNKKVFEHDSDELKLARFLKVCIKENKPDAEFKDSILQGWAADIDKLIRIDKAKVNEIAEVIEWCQKDDFWKTNVLSGASLRKQYLRLSMKALTER